MCSILKDHDSSMEEEDHNREEGGILDVCLQLIVRERISLERENLEVERIRNLYHKSALNTSYYESGKPCLRAWKTKANNKQNKYLKSQ